MASCNIGDIGDILCKENLINMQDIIDKVVKLEEVNACLVDCCATTDDGDVIRSLLVDNRLFLTDDSSAPIEVSRNGTEPIETYLMSEEMKKIDFMGTAIKEMYMNGDLVFIGTLELTLPQYLEEINLQEFISNNNPYEYEIVTITNNLIQPSIVTGNICGFEVTLINNGEIQGISSGGDALTLTCPLLLTNNGWIRGAGGDGGDGAGFDASNIPSYVRQWEGRVTYDDGGPYVSGQISPLWCNVSTCGYHAYYNRFWKVAGGTNSGAWVMSGGPSGQEYWNTALHDVANAPVWGDQGYCHFNTSGFWCRDNGGLQIAVKVDISITGGSSGNGGRGVGFQIPQDDGWSAGINGTYSGPSTGFDDNGYNIALPSSGDMISGDGGHGGTWGQDGTPGQPGLSYIAGDILDYGYVPDKSQWHIRGPGDAESDDCGVQVVGYEVNVYIGDTVPGIPAGGVQAEIGEWDTLSEAVAITSGVVDGDTYYKGPYVEQSGGYCDKIMDRLRWKVSLSAPVEYGSGDAGLTAGRGIVGSVFLVSGSTTGNVNGDIV